MTSKQSIFQRTAGRLESPPAVSVKEQNTMGKKLYLLLLLICFFIFAGCEKQNNNEHLDSSVYESEETDIETSSVSEYPIDDIFVYRYNPKTNSRDYWPVGYVDEYTSLAIETDQRPEEVIEDSTMYLGNIKGYKNEDWTLEIYQVTLTERNNLLLTNNNVNTAYIGVREAVDVTGYIYMDGTTILAVTPLWPDNNGGD